jgi:hypothetical protein
MVGGGSSGLAGESTISVVPSWVQKASQSSSKVRLQVGQRFISKKVLCALFFEL